MRAIIKRAYEQSELIINTGYSYQFVSNLEKGKYKEYLLPNNYIENASNAISNTELDEVITLFQSEGKPFVLGELNGSERHFYNFTEYEVIEKIQKFKSRNKPTFVNKSDTDFNDLYAKWNKLTNNQRDILDKLINEFTQINTK